MLYLVIAGKVIGFNNFIPLLEWFLTGGLLFSIAENFPGAGAMKDKKQESR